MAVDQLLDSALLDNKSVWLVAVLEVGITGPFRQMSATARCHALPGPTGCGTRPDGAA